MTEELRRQLRIQRRITAKLRAIQRTNLFIARRREEQRLILEQLRILRASNEKREQPSSQIGNLVQEQPMNQQQQQQGISMFEPGTRLLRSRFQNPGEHSSSSSHIVSPKMNGEPKRRWTEMIAENGVSETELKRLRSANSISEFDGGNQRLLLLAEAGAELLLELEKKKRGSVSNDRDNNQEVKPLLQNMHGKNQCGSSRNDQDQEVVPFIPGRNQCGSVRNDQEVTPLLQNMPEESRRGSVQNDQNHRQEVKPSLQNLPEKSQFGLVKNDLNCLPEVALPLQNMPEKTQCASVGNGQDHHLEVTPLVKNTPEKTDQDHHQEGAPLLQNMPQKIQPVSVRNDQNQQEEAPSVQNMLEKNQCMLDRNDKGHHQEGHSSVDQQPPLDIVPGQSSVDQQPLPAIEVVHNSETGCSSLRVRGRVRLSDIKRQARLGNARPRPVENNNVVNVEEQMDHQKVRDNHNPPSVTVDHDAHTHNKVAMDHAKQQNQVTDHVKEQINQKTDEDDHDIPSAKRASDNFHVQSPVTKHAEQENVSQGEGQKQSVVISQLQERNRENQGLRERVHRAEITNEPSQLPGVQILKEHATAPPGSFPIFHWHTTVQQRVPQSTGEELRREHLRSVACGKGIETSNGLTSPQKNPLIITEQVEDIGTALEQSPIAINEEPVQQVVNIAHLERLEKREHRKRPEDAIIQRNLMINQQRDRELEMEHNPQRSVDINRCPEDLGQPSENNQSSEDHSVEILAVAPVEGNAEVQGKPRLIQIRRQARQMPEELMENQSDNDDSRTQTVEAMNVEAIHGGASSQSDAGNGGIETVEGMNVEAIPGDTNNQTDAGQSSYRPFQNTSELQEMELRRLAFQHQQTQQLRMNIIRRCMAVRQQTVLTSPEHTQKLRELQHIIARQQKLIRINRWRKFGSGRRSNAVQNQRNRLSEEQRERVREAQRQWLLRRAQVVREECLAAAEKRQEERIQELTASLNWHELASDDAGRTHNLLVQLEGQYNSHRSVENNQIPQGNNVSSGYIPPNCPLHPGQQSMNGQPMNRFNPAYLNFNNEVGSSSLPANRRTRLNQIRNQARLTYTHTLEIDVGSQMSGQNNEELRNTERRSIIYRPIAPRNEILRGYPGESSTSRK